MSSAKTVALTGQDRFLLPVEADPPLHTRYRLAMNSMFAPAEISRLDARMRDYARVEMTASKSRRSCEFVADFTFRFPIVVFLELMGLPVENMMQLLLWEQSVLRASGTDIRIVRLRDCLIDWCAIGSEFEFPDYARAAC